MVEFDIAQYKEGMEPLPLDDPEYLARNRQAFEAYLVTLGVSTTPQLHRRKFVGYLQPEAQARWCSWCEALRFARAKRLLPEQAAVR